MNNLIIFDNLRYIVGDDGLSLTVGDGTGKNTNAIEDYSLQTETLIIPKYVKWRKVTKIGEKAFNKAHILKRVYINAPITIISNYAFDQCYNLEYINIPPSVETIGVNALCMSLSDDAEPSDGIVTIIIQPNSNLSKIENGGISLKKNYIISYCGPKSLTNCGGDLFSSSESITLYTYEWIQFCNKNEGVNRKEIHKDVLCPYFPPIITPPCITCLTQNRFNYHVPLIFLIYSKI